LAKRPLQNSRVPMYIMQYWDTGTYSVFLVDTKTEGPTETIVLLLPHWLPSITTQMQAGMKAIIFK
jgi:hypothetical protein